MQFSIIIPAKNEERVIGTCLQHIADLDFRADDFEVILADNGSTDRTVEIFRSWSDRLNLSAVERPDVSIAALRNAAAAISRGKLLGFLDADCLVPRNWLKDAEDFLEGADAKIVGAHFRIPNDSTWIARCWFDDEHSNRAGETSYVPSGDLLVSRSTFDRIGGFDESLQTNEDYEFCQRAKRAGFSVYSFPQLEVIHLGTPQSISAFYHKQAWHGQHVLRVFVQNLPRFYNARVVFLALYTFLGLLAALCGAIALVITGNPQFLVAAILFCLGGPFFLALRAAIQRRKLTIFVPLIFLYLVYGVARASCILQSLSGWNLTRRHAPGRMLTSQESRELRGTGSRSR
jgi:glycosyltransferase involved in cell wall biosynthesis